MPLDAPRLPTAGADDFPNPGLHQENETLVFTTYERGRFEERRKLVLMMLEVKFGPVAEGVKERVEALFPEQLLRLALALVKGRSLKELGLHD